MNGMTEIGRTTDQNCTVCLNKIGEGIIYIGESGPMHPGCAPNDLLGWKHLTIFDRDAGLEQPKEPWLLVSEIDLDDPVAHPKIFIVRLRAIDGEYHGSLEEYSIDFTEKWYWRDTRHDKTYPFNYFKYYQPIAEIVDVEWYGEDEGGTP